MSRPLLRFLIFAFMASFATAPAATISAGQPEALPDGKFTLPIHYQPGPNESVSGLQFEITFDPAQTTLEEIAPGPVATLGGKMVSFNRLNNGRCRVIIAGFNQNVLAPGVLATLRLRHPAGPLAIALENPVLSDPKGQAVRGTATGLQLSPASPAAPPPPPSCACAPAHSPSYKADLLLLLLTMTILVLHRRQGESAKRRCNR